MEKKKSEYEAVSTSLDEKDSSSKESEMKQQDGIYEKICRFIPILYWLPRYKWKKDISGDIIAGLTVGIMHVPQGMAYASLAGVPPVYGMYSSFFASTVYMFFGTARHISIGVFAVASMMVGAAKSRILAPHILANGTNIDEKLLEIEGLQLTSALTLLVGVVQLILGFLRLGFLTTYLSDPLVGGFTTGSAVHVLMSQLNKVFGVKLPRHEGLGMLVFMFKDLVLSIPKTNFVALIISVSGIIFLDLGRTYLNPFTKKFCPIPLPLELILVIIGCVVSVVFGLEKNYHIKTVHTIPKGLPLPSIPNPAHFPSLISDAFPIAIVCYMFVVSMGKLFAKKHKYKIDPTQELRAVGMMSILSSFFPVYPVGASLSRSSVCEMSGAKTQLYTVFSSSLLLLVILFIGPFLEPLPMCILAAIVIVSLKSLFLQVKDLKRLWKICRYDCAIWLVSCLSTILTDVTKGLVISVLFAILTIVLREQWPTFPHVENSDIPPQVKPDNMQIIKISTPIHFANVERMVEAFYTIIEQTEKQTIMGGNSSIIIDCSSMSYIDSMGIDYFTEIYQTGKKSGVTVVFAGVNDDILDIFKTDDKTTKLVPEGMFLKTINEAILYLNSI